MKNSNQSGPILKPSLPNPQTTLSGYGGQFKVAGFTGTGGISLGGLTYSTAAGQGQYGLGFKANNETGITRSTHRHTPTFDDTLDSFELDGDLLVPYLTSEGKRVVKYGALETVANAPQWKRPQLKGDYQPSPANGHPHAYQVRQYRPQKEDSYAQVYYWKRLPGKSSLLPSSFWLVIGPDNSLTLFGVSNTAKVSDRSLQGVLNPDRVCTWLAEEHLDAMGHATLTKYTQENEVGINQEMSCEENHHHRNKIYLDRTCSGHTTPLPASLVLSKALDKNITEPDWFFETVWDYGQYNLQDLKQQAVYQPYDPDKGITHWAKRQDSHSDYSCGFEIRTHRLCRQVLEFHRFPEEFGTTTPLLHSATAYIYDESPLHTLLIAVQEVGYYWNGHSYDVNYMPPMEMEYNRFAPENRPYREMLVKDTNSKDEPLPKLAGIGSSFFPTDLYGEGIAGMLASNGHEAFYYQTNWDSLDSKLGGSSPVHYKQTANPVRLPLGMLHKDGNHQLMDINGNGRLDYVTSYAGQLGYYEALQNENNTHTGQPIDAWGEFTPIPLTPVEMRMPQHFLVDVTGNHIVDCIIPMDQGRLRYYKNNGPKGFEVGEEILNSPLPSSIQSSEEVFLGFINIAGDGKQHLVHLDKTGLRYYPNLGYGRFGAPITMDNFPTFAEDELKTSRIYFADLDGTGCADLIVAKQHHISIYPNLCGNSFGSEINISYPDQQTYDDFHTHLQFADVFGNGLTCLIFQKTGPDARQWVYDFNGGVKPYLLTRYTNNLGAVTHTTYRSSVHFYLEDKKQGIEWFTRAPFPVWSVHEVVIHDEISKSTLTETYHYRHSYYDGIEKIFRGYGYAEHTDTISNYDNNRLPQNSPPSKSCVWYHSGNPRQEAITELYQKLEYFMAGGQGGSLPFNASKKDPRVRYLKVHNPNFRDVSATPELTRQAHLHLAGTLIRAEIYGIAQETYAQNPASTAWELYSTSMSNETVQLVQPLMSETLSPPLLNYASFQLLPRENLAYQYERNLHDPVVGYTAAIQFDAFGHVLQNCTLQYPRRKDYQDANDEATNEQRTLRCMTTIHRIENFVNAGITGDEFYSLGIPTHSMAYYIKNPASLGTLDQETSTDNVFNNYQGEIFSYDTLQTFLRFASIAADGKTVAFAHSSLRTELLHWSSRAYYYVQSSAAASAPAPTQGLDLQRVGYRGFLLPKGGDGTAESMFDATALENILDDFFTSSELTNLMAHPHQGNYQSLTHATLEGSSPANSQSFWASKAGTYTYNNSAKFYALEQYTDPMGNITHLTHDRYNLMAIESRDALNNISKVAKLTTKYADNTPRRAIDYQFLQPFKIIDLNDNASEVVFDALGRVVASSHYGTSMHWNKESDTYEVVAEGFGKLYTPGTSNKTYVVDGTVGMQSVIDNPMHYLQKAATYVHYQPFSWMGQVSKTHLENIQTGLYDHLKNQGFINGEGAILNRLRKSTLTPDGLSKVNLGDFVQALKLDFLKAHQQQAVLDMLYDKTTERKTPTHVLTTAAKDYPDTSYARVSKEQLLALGETTANVDDWFTQAYAAQYLKQETGPNNGHSTFGIFEYKMRQAVTTSQDATTFAQTLANDGKTLLAGAFHAFTNKEAIFRAYQQALHQRIEQHVQYSDGLGRSLQGKVKAEPGKECFLYKNGQVTTHKGSEQAVRWLTQGHVTYNNKGEVVLAYDPYFIDTPAFVESEVLQTLGTSPINFYDALGRVTHSYTPKGYLLTHQWTAWGNTVWDANDCLLLSPYYQVNQQFLDNSHHPLPQSQHDPSKYFFDYTDEKLAKINSGSEDEKKVAQSIRETMQQTLRLAFTPTNTTHDNRGLTLRSRQTGSYQHHLVFSKVGNVLEGTGIMTGTYELLGYHNKLVSLGYLEKRILGNQLKPGQRVVLKDGKRVVLQLGNQTPELLLRVGTHFALKAGTKVTLDDARSYTVPNNCSISIAATQSPLPHTRFLLWQPGQTLPQRLAADSQAIHADGTLLNLVDGTMVTLAANSFTITPGLQLELQRGQAIELVDDSTIMLSQTTVTSFDNFENGRTFLISPHEIWGEMTQKYPVLAQGEIQQLVQGLDHQLALYAPAILAVLWALEQTNTSGEGSKEEIITIFKNKFEQILGVSAPLWNKEDYWALFSALTTLNFLEVNATNSASPKYSFRVKAVHYLPLDNKDNPRLNLVLMLGWAKGQQFETSSYYDVYGRLTKIADPRFSIANAKKIEENDKVYNLTTTYAGALGGTVMTDYADAGPAWALPDVLGRHLWNQDARNIETKVGYDALHRPLYIRQTATQKNEYFIRNKATGRAITHTSIGGNYLEEKTFKDEEFHSRQKFKIIKSPDGTYHKIVSGFNGLYVSVPGLAPSVGSKVVSLGPGNIPGLTERQNFIIEESDHGYFKIKSTFHKGYVFKANGFINLETEHENAAQLWELVPASDWSVITSRIAYGENITNAQQYNLRGQAVQTFTQGAWGAASHGFNILGQSLGSSTKLVKAFIPDFAHNVPKPCVDLSSLELVPEQTLQNVALSTELSHWLLTETYENLAEFDAVGEVQRTIDVARNIHLPQFHLSGGVAQMKVNGINFMDEVVYNARKQKLSLKTKNTANALVTHCHYTYDPKNYGLVQIYASHNDSEVNRTNEQVLIYHQTGHTRQNLIYTFDPAGNVAALPVNVYQGPDKEGNIHNFSHKMAYRYDGLYRLVRAQGTPDS